MSGSLYSIEYLFEFLGGGSVRSFQEVAVYVGGGARSCVTRSTCHRYDRYSCGDLHRDIRMSKTVNGAFFKTCRATNLFHPQIYTAIDRLILADKYVKKSYSPQKLCVSLINMQVRV